jgi:hypothetical protein
MSALVSLDQQFTPDCQVRGGTPCGRSLIASELDCQNGEVPYAPEIKSGTRLEFDAIVPPAKTPFACFEARIAGPFQAENLDPRTLQWSVSSVRYDFAR